MQRLSSYRLEDQPFINLNGEQNEEGFADDEVQAMIIPKDDTHFTDSIAKTANLNKTKKKSMEPKLKLTFMGKQQSMAEQMRKAIIHKQDRNLNARSLDLNKKENKQSMYYQMISSCAIKIKRTVIGQNLIAPVFLSADSNAVKSWILSSGGSLVYQQSRQFNTHGYLKSINQTHNHAFLMSDLNKLLKNKLKDSFILAKRPIMKANQDAIKFESGFQSSNLEFVSKINDHQYQLFLKNDTNTHGHQSWFNFKLTNTKNQPTSLQLSICNMKRDMRMITQGQKVYFRKAGADWKPAGDNITIKMNNNCRFSASRTYRLSFNLQVEGSASYEISLLPPYTYATLLQDISKLSPLYTHIQTLTYSLLGLAIPILTFTDKTIDDSLKNCILISARVHPGQTVASFMAKGLMEWLSQGVNRQFLQKTVIKIIPMINPDGVIYGNFRTNYLGTDLNRHFDSEDEVVNPQIYALKSLGRKLKEEFKDRFTTFIDLHGHSSSKNVFAYGPDYSIGDNNFYQIRLLPKILNSKSQMFKYSSCSFRLEDYKKHTARGFFISQLSIPAYTIEASYAFYVSDEGINMMMGTKDWQKFGKELGEGLFILGRLSKLSSIRSRMELKKITNQSQNQQLQMMKKFRKQLKKEDSSKKIIIDLHKQNEDSDGQPDVEDFNKQQRQEIQRRIAQSCIPQMILPRVLKPAVLYPTVTPKLFKVRQQLQVTNLKILYTKRNRYPGRRSSNYYIHSLRGIEALKPTIKSILPSEEKDFK